MPIDINNFQRLGSSSNANVGSDFEGIAHDFFASQGIHLTRNYSAEVGVGTFKKHRRFDLGSSQPAVLVECKSHRWTQGGNVPSAKITVWNEAMYYFHIAPSAYRKIFFVLKDSRREQSLAAYYLRLYGHLVPHDVEVWEYNLLDKTSDCLHLPHCPKSNA